MINLISKTLSIITLSMFLIACGGGGGDSSSSSISSSSSSSAVSVTSTNVALSWIAPSTKVDGSFLPLSEIAGYRIYRGIDQYNLILLTETTDPSNSEYTLTETEAGTYYYAVTTYNVDGLESSYSATISKTVS